MGEKRNLFPSLILVLFVYFFSSITFAEEDIRLQKNLYIIFDGSGSMGIKKCSGNQRKIDVAKEALITFLKTVPNDYNVGLYVFDKKGSREVVPISRLNKELLIATTEKIRNGGSTPLCASIERAKEALLKQKEKQLSYGEYTMLIVTDGEANQVSRLPSIVKPVTDSGITIQVIGFCLGKTHSLKFMVNKYREANSPEELKAALKNVLGEANEFTDMSSFEYFATDDLNAATQQQVAGKEVSHNQHKNPISNTLILIIIFLIVFFTYFIMKKGNKD